MFSTTVKVVLDSVYCMNWFGPFFLLLHNTDPQTDFFKDILHIEDIIFQPWRWDCLLIWFINKTQTTPLMGLTVLRPHANTI